MSGFFSLYISIFFFCSCIPLTLKAQVSLPLEKIQMTSPFGFRIHPISGSKQFHSGIDLSARYEPVYAILSGVVNATGEDEIIGKYVKIDHGGMQSIYGHLSSVWVGKGDTLHSGQIIAVSGSSGRSTGPHLHLSIKISGKFFNPLAVIKVLLASTLTKHMDTYSTIENDKLSLAAILYLLAERGSISLSETQAREYGVDQADELPIEEEGGDDGF
ncbi:M23 family metallopeptidase [Pedobacter jamesrossensis]|uniref:M23 family metallopeptidase n=1 Tax=Pedobacter jamesrossensis TaxID=1908238 RepID=A0ABV8NNK9_9SPHI